MEPAVKEYLTEVLNTPHWVNLSREGQYAVIAPHPALSPDQQKLLSAVLTGPLFSNFQRSHFLNGHLRVPAAALQASGILTEETLQALNKTERTLL